MENERIHGGKDMPLFEWGKGQEEDLMKRRLEEMEDNDSNIPFVGAYGSEVSEEVKRERQEASQREINRDNALANLEDANRNLTKTKSGKSRKEIRDEEKKKNLDDVEKTMEYLSKKYNLPRTNKKNSESK